MQNYNKVQLKKEMPDSIKTETKELLLLKETTESKIKLINIYNEYVQGDYMKINCNPCSNYAKMMLRRALNGS